jgi:hypothetical protein
LQSEIFNPRHFAEDRLWCRQHQGVIVDKDLCFTREQTDTAQPLEHEQKIVNAL